MSDLPLDPPRWRTALADDAARMIEAVGSSPEAQVAACPGWTTTQVLDHVAGLYVFVTGILAGRGAQPAAPAGSVKAEGADLQEASRTALTGLLAALDAADPDDPAWNWSPEDDTARFWFRRMSQETLTHRLDVELATGRVGDVDPALAADGVDEVLTLFLPRVFRRKGGFTQLVGTLKVSVTDADAGPWYVEITDADIFVRSMPGAVRAVIEAVPDLEIEGTALEVLLYLWGRGDAASVGVDPTHRMAVGLDQEFTP